METPQPRTLHPLAIVLGRVRFGRDLVLDVGHRVSVPIDDRPVIHDASPVPVLGALYASSGLDLHQPIDPQVSALCDGHAGSQHPVAILADYTAIDQTVTLVSGILQEMISQF